MCAVSETTRNNSITLEATVRNLPLIMAFLGERLDAWGCPMRKRMAIELAVEEVYVNIANYAYAPGSGEATMRVELETSDAARTIVITFIDQGIPYDPLAREDPDVTLPTGKRRIGGLGIFLVKQQMDDVAYEYRDGSNVLTLKKFL